MGDRAVRDRILGPFGGTGLYPVAGLFLILFGTCFLISNLLSSSAILWTGTPVPATEQDGIVYYSFGHQRYTIDDVRSYGSGPRTVYLDPADPSHAMIYSTGSRVFDVVSTAGPYSAAVGFFAAGFVRRRRNRRRLQREREHSGPLTFGQGLDSEMVAQLIARRRTAELGRRPPVRPPE